MSWSIGRPRKRWKRKSRYIITQKTLFLYYNIASCNCHLLLLNILIAYWFVKKGSKENERGRFLTTKFDIHSKCERKCQACQGYFDDDESNKFYENPFICNRYIYSSTFEVGIQILMHPRNYRYYFNCLPLIKVWGSNTVEQLTLTNPVILCWSIMQIQIICNFN